MKKAEIVAAILGERLRNSAYKFSGRGFAPTNIALCKYWGKRDREINLPVTSSLSVSLGSKGATVELKISKTPQDIIVLNGQPVDIATSFSRRLIEFLNLFRTEKQFRFSVNITSNIPIAAGLASSACGFASIVLALNELFDWGLSQQQLSILARLGSGSACRSVSPGFVEWHVGVRSDGLDSYGEVIDAAWPELCVGLLLLSEKEKPISSTDAMQRTVTTSTLYSAWPTKVNHDLSLLKEAISLHDFQLLGRTAESNAMTMHATMMSAWPSIVYMLPETLLSMQKVWRLRYDEGLSLYFTQDAGPNLKLLFLKSDLPVIQEHFVNVEVVQPFAS